MKADRKALMQLRRVSTLRNLQPAFRYVDQEFPFKRPIQTLLIRTRRLFYGFSSKESSRKWLQKTVVFSVRSYIRLGSCTEIGGLVGIARVCKLGGASQVHHPMPKAPWTALTQRQQLYASAGRCVRSKLALTCPYDWPLFSSEHLKHSLPP